VLSPVLRRRVRQASRRALISVAPRVYWGFRRWRRGDEELELKLLPILCSRERTSIDIGANFGMWTVRMAALSRKCIAFEPIPALGRMLARGFGRSVEVHGAALSDRRGIAKLRVPDLDTGYATIDPANALRTHKGRSVADVEVELATLDDFGLTNVGFVKIDVEGHEEAVLRGAVETIARCRPNFIIEVEDRHNAGSVGRVVSWMAERGYSALVIHDGVMLDLARFDLSAHQAKTRTDRYARNVVFIPDERRPELWDDIENALRRA
jgi:FkbM family methyltransferase